MTLLEAAQLSGEDMDANECQENHSPPRDKEAGNGTETWNAAG